MDFHPGSRPQRSPGSTVGVNYRQPLPSEARLIPAESAGELPSASLGSLRAPDHLNHLSGSIETATINR